MQPTAQAPAVSTLAIPTWTEFQSMRALWAMQVPAFNRGVRLISGTVAQLPLTEWSDGEPVVNAFLEQPEAARPRWVTMQRTVRDLILYGKAYWQVAPGGITGGFPRFVNQVDFDRVSAPAGEVFIDGQGPFPISNPATPGASVGDVIVFDGFHDGVLITGVDTITTALAQEQASRSYSEAPAPTQILKNTSNYELSDTEIDELLAAYTAARKESAVAYLNGGVDLTTFGYSALDLQLVESRNQSAIQIARLLNLDPFWVGAGVPGSSLTYQNRVDMRQDLVDLTLSDYLVPIEQRISMWDVTPTKLKHVVRFDTSEFLRSNLDARARMAIDLFTAGVIDQDEARAFVSDKPSGGPS